MRANGVDIEEGAGKIELGEDPGGVSFDRCLAADAGLSDLDVAHTPGDQPEYLDLAWRESRQLRLRDRWLRRGGVARSTMRFHTSL